MIFSSFYLLVAITPADYAAADAITTLNIALAHFTATFADIAAAIIRRRYEIPH
jgi:hypothetical protein